MFDRKKSPYVGVSGVINPEQQRILEDTAEDAGLFDHGRKLALGVKAVHKTQFLDVENKYGKEWYPVGEAAFRGALTNEYLEFDTIKVAQAYFDIEHVADSEYREVFLNRIADRGSPWIQAIQFDMLPWHTNSDMFDFLESVKLHNIALFLQVHKPAMEALGAQGVTKKLARHAGLIDYLLFDSSHGTGTRLDTSTLRPFIAEAYEAFDSSIGIALAGGLNGTVIREDLPSIVSEFPDISWDAEGQLHPLNEKGKRPLDMGVVHDYLNASVDIMSY